MSKIDQKQVERLVELIGGKGNIASVSHCLTRLRFALGDPELANVKEIEKITMVKGAFTTAGQFQIVIGTEVDEVYKILTKITGGGDDKEATKAAARQNMNLLERGISHMAEIFVPLLPAIITGGLI
ncbi:glucose PTS transporter subunit EIIB, partial [Psychromonas sp.]|uniref:glucose PTS transporter subunit EIIB n=1 Tax=Psychromonas sp. TaxID=1884585 RepID=UPI0039E24012